MKPAAPTAPTVHLLADPAESTEYRLLELPPEIAALLENGGDDGNGHKSTGKRKRTDIDDGSDDDDGIEWDTGRRILTINGRYLDDATVCTESRTYNLRHVSQSNSLLLCTLLPASSVTLASTSTRETSPASSDSAVLLKCSAASSGAGATACRQAGHEGQAVLSLKCTVKDTLELQWAMPKLERIATLLKASAYRGPDEEERRSKKLFEGAPGDRLYTMKEVRSVVQASRTELEAGLDLYRVVKLDGHARLISRTYLAKSVLPALLNHLDLHDYCIDNVPESSTIDALATDHGVSRIVAKKVLIKWFGKRIRAGASNGDAEDGDDVHGDGEDLIAKGKGRERSVALKGQEMAKTIGLELLQDMASGQPTKLAAFMARWAEMVGDALVEHANVDLLKNGKSSSLISPPCPFPSQGEHLMYPVPPLRPSSSHPARIQYFPRSALPLDAAARFQELFLTRSQWLLPDLLPFVDSLAINQNKRDALLIKFCRTSRVLVPPEEHAGLGGGAGASAAKGAGAKRARNKTPGPAVSQKVEHVVVYSSRLRY
ncbi:hypothetical protein K437DRAFT_291082 [Tilletiaria anomala UBC 951]|uniref:Sister chromatid cohesion protein DCC1 n=1 Tax=Tilletiaria anomala (strain ATCC 24038 / CBS 436.72 / UBC 951) TaxID=1037660 RepID=A0A066VXY0_TILAU|nr:uncharacterized protein K437DRAFT_291082 [Tilletiaria anomala UBC 951]KDN43679.1 hypothetical protein K437DRAFT_291082 [Tilletiaria anomala UBC 951]